MKLVDLDPRWFSFGSKEKAGFVFRCPHCTDASPREDVGATFILCKSIKMAVIEDQCAAIAEQHPDIDVCEMVPASEEVCWNIAGDDFNTLTVTPSLDALAAGHWHGFITNGEIR